MKRIFPMVFSVLGFLMLLLSACTSSTPRVLVFSKTAAFHHASIPAGISAIMKLGAENHFAVDTTTDATWFQDDTLRKYAAVIFLSTTGDVLDQFQEAAFERYIQAGGGFVGIHAATDTEYDWGWYGRLVGGYFNGHPQIQEAALNVVDAQHEATKHLPNPWKRTDEWYNFRDLNPDVHVLLKIDEKSYTGGTNGDNHPMAWYHDYDGGRAFYTELGHTEESYSEPNYLKHILGGIKYAIGNNKKLNYSKAVTLNVPEERRFTKTPLVQATFFEPTEMTILPNLDILVAQRRGEILLYKNKDNSVKPALELNVYWKTDTPNVNAEEGVLGLQKDPDFEKNHFVYIFYSPIDTSVNRLSRFVFENDSLTSEKIILQFYSQRQICCHTGGSIAFGKDRLLYLSTGDDSTPFDEPGNPYSNHGFSPTDDLPGKQQYDARRSAGNTNDLRGKILRIKINEDGTYDIPDGNLFPKNEAKTRPEIYVMGNRNPYRISVDQKTGFLYWGEVGPDADHDSLDTRGPRGYDEVNQARKAGYFGWPLFVGNNYAYHAYDYATGKFGPPFNPEKPVNNSRNNTGLQELPPAQPAFIWYPYAKSPDFPQVGSGGRNAMAGPVYYTDMFPKETRLPDFYNGKFFIYDWIRGWIKVVTMWPNGDFEKMEPFMPHTKFFNPIDMEVGPDGKIYILEYGTGWFNKNPDAGLYRIDYNGGNLPPKIIEDVTADKTSGALPLKARLTLKAEDTEHDPVTYVWNINNDREVKTTDPVFEETFTTAGDYNISVEVCDSKGACTKGNTINIYAGNEAPVVNISLTGNKTFYFPGKQVAYTVKVEDKDDPTAANDMSGLVVAANYEEGYDRAAIAQGHQILSEAAMGKNLMMSLDCQACHKIAEKSIGPAYTEVAKRYKNDANIVPYLTQKIVHGGSGVWGETAMAAHPDLSVSDVHQIIAWIQSLAMTESKVKSLPASGSVSPTADKPLKDNGVLVLTATYTDKGGEGVKPLSSSTMVALRNSKVTFNDMDASATQGFAPYNYQGATYLVVPTNEGWFKIDSIDLTNIRQAMLGVGWRDLPVPAYFFELRLDAPNGEKIGTVIFNGVEGSNKMTQVISGAINPVTDGKMHDLYVVNQIKDNNAKNPIVLSFIQFSTAAGGGGSASSGGQ